MDIVQWIVPIDQVTESFRNEFGNLSVSQLNWKPDDRTWSVSQNVDHLIVTNESYYSVIERVREGAYKLPWTGKVGFMVNFFGKLVLKAVLPDRKKKMKTFPVWEPKASEIGADVIHRFIKHQSELKELIGDCMDLMERGTIISSPANRYIVYTLEAAFTIMVAHEKRHLEQAREVFKRQPG